MCRKSVPLFNALPPSPPPPSQTQRSLRKDKTETKKSMHMSTELLDLDEALSFLQEVAHNPEGVKVKRALSPLEKWKGSPTASPEPQRVRLYLYVCSNVVCTHIRNLFTVLACLCFPSQLLSLA